MTQVIHEAMYDIAEIRLDLLPGANNNLQGKMTDQQKDIENKRA